MTSTKTDAAFGAFRDVYGPARPPDPRRIRNADELEQMTPADGLLTWADGAGASASSSPPLIPETPEPSLWVVRAGDVVYARERCSFGSGLETGVIKHTNLTGGAPAFVGGEMLVSEEGVIVLNGCSGRYPSRTSAELEAVAQAFKASGYTVWSMGFDEEANFPFPFIGVEPRLVA